MKQELAWLVLSATMVGCGGGSKDGTDPITPPAPTVKILSGSLIRQAAINTGLSLDVAVQPSFSPKGTLYVVANDIAGLMLQDVLVTSNQDRTFTLTVATRQSMPAGHYKGDITLKLCSDQACATPQPVPSISVPYDITVVAPGSAWPSDNLTPLTAWDNVPEWNMFQGNAAHTGYVPVELAPDKFSLRWKTGPISGSAFSRDQATVTVANGLFYAAGAKALNARREFDGSVVWTYDVSTLRYPSVNAPAIVNGVVYMAAGQQDSTFMFGLDAATGTVRFKSPMSSQWEYYLAPVVLNDTVYTNAGAYGGMYGFTSAGEQLFYITSLPQVSLWTPAVDSEVLYAYVGTALTMFDPKSGKELSRISDSSVTSAFEMHGAPVLGSPGTVFAANYSVANWDNFNPNELLKFNTDKGYIDWRIAGAYPVTPAYADGVLYAPNRNPVRLEARAGADGGLLWSWVPPVAGESTWPAEPIVTKNHIFVSTNYATYAIDRRSHKTVWSYPFPGRLALSRSGILYIQSKEALMTVNLE